MLRLLKGVLPFLAVAGLVFSVSSSFAGQKASAGDEQALTVATARTGVTLNQLREQAATQTAAMTRGTIRLRVIPHVGGKTVGAPIAWRIVTYGRDASGKRVEVARVDGATPELVLPAGWYIVHAQLPDQVIRHPVEVSAGRIFKYTLLKN
jgi:hypothetical protein